MAPGRLATGWTPLVQSTAAPSDGPDTSADERPRHLGSSGLAETNLVDVVWSFSRSFVRSFVRSFCFFRWELEGLDL